MSILQTVLIVLITGTSLLAGIGPGDIFREYTYIDSAGGPNFNECAPGAQSGFCKEAPKQRIRLLKGIDLENAVRAELEAAIWSGHIGTGGRQFCVNGNTWIKLPEPQKTETRPEHYHRTLMGNSPVSIPVEHLKSGDNAFQFTCTPQVKFNFDWGFYWIYCFTLRVYYNASVDHPEGEILHPKSGMVIGDREVLDVSLDNMPAAVQKIDIIGQYSDYDWEGNGLFHDWHYQLIYGQRQFHVATISGRPTIRTTFWDNAWIPDQQHIKLLGIIIDQTGLSHVMPLVDSLTLERPDRMVKMYPPTDVPEKFIAYRGLKPGCRIVVEDDLTRAVRASLVISTWSGIEAQEIRLNDCPLESDIGIEVDRSYDRLEVPVSCLKQGDNHFSVYSLSDYHGAEINLPGPVLFIEFSKKDKDLSPGGFQALIDSLESGHWVTRMKSAKSLGRLKDPRAVEPLLRVFSREPLFKQKYWHVRRNAAWALDQITDQKAVLPLIAGLHSDEWSTVVYAINALEKFNDPATEEPLLHCLNHKRTDVRRLAARGLGKLKSKKALLPLTNLLIDQTDVNFVERVMVLTALWEIGDEKCLPAVKRALKDESKDVRLKAGQVLDAFKTRQ